MWDPRARPRAEVGAAPSTNSNVQGRVCVCVPIMFTVSGFLDSIGCMHSLGCLSLRYADHRKAEHDQVNDLLFEVSQ